MGRIGSGTEASLVALVALVRALVVGTDGSGWLEAARAPPWLSAILGRETSEVQLFCCRQHRKRGRERTNVR